MEEFFQNKHSKKQVDLSSSLASTGENLAHLLFLYAPYVHPKFILKRKDPNLKEVLSSKDKLGSSPLLRVAQIDSKVVLHRILASKVARDSKLLDLNAKDASGRNVLHHVLKNQDTQAFRDLLDHASSSSSSNSLAADLSWCSAPDPKSGRTPLQTLLSEASAGRAGLIRDLLTHSPSEVGAAASTAAAAFGELSSKEEGEGEERKKSLLHILVEGGQQDLFDLALQRRDMVLDANTKLFSQLIKKSFSPAR